MPRFARARPVDILDGTVDYLAETREGPVGVVDRWKRDEQGSPSAIVIAQGWFGRRRFEIPIDQVIEIDHEDRRVLLAPAAAPPESRGLLRQPVAGERVRTANGDTAPPPPGLGPQPVLCGVAEDLHAPVVVRIAARFARALAAPLILAHVTQADFPPGISAAAYGQARLLEEQHEHADEFTDNLIMISGLAPTTPVKRIIGRGTAAETLEQLAEIERAQLLVIGTTGKGSLATLLKGSVSHHVSSHAPCPVVLVPPRLSIATDEEAEETASELPDEATLGLSRTDWQPHRMSRRASTTLPPTVK